MNMPPEGAHVVLPLWVAKVTRYALGDRPYVQAKAVNGFILNQAIWARLLLDRRSLVQGYQRRKGYRRYRGTCDALDLASRCGHLFDRPARFQTLWDALPKESFNGSPCRKTSTPEI